MNIRVGISRGAKIEFSLNDDFILKQNGSTTRGNFVVEFSNNGILFNKQLFGELYFAAPPSSTFGIKDVVIGKDFHWQQKRNQSFEGDLLIVSDGNELVAINVVDIEKYIYSVIASEMSSTSFVELLKAHAVISRSWVLAALQSAKKELITTPQTDTVQDNDTYIKWYERDAHTLFDVCADDHCQRYQGIPMVETSALKQAIEATAGEVLNYNGEVCDARFSKCCGGYTERFSACWADMEQPYLTSKPDSINNLGLRLTDEDEARRFIVSKPKMLCNTTDKSIIDQVFNDYDQQTQAFFRWQVKYSPNELSQIVGSRSGYDFGDIIDLVPLCRGSSGRITLLKIVGTKLTISVGKELEIRRWLSRSHLYSSAFVVDRDSEGYFVLSGAGWGHGVGLCQIGAAVMAAKGYNYRQILEHYYEGSNLYHISQK
ncbi:amidase [Porphyromonadaceae bacterium COT-184 OH4590]|nr:amidase [Porphyromonadaceae bacterium COT-184 OH4590]